MQATRASHHCRRCFGCNPMLGKNRGAKIKPLIMALNYTTSAITNGDVESI